MRAQSLSPVEKGPKAFPTGTVMKEESESDTESTAVESDLNTTVLSRDPDPSGTFTIKGPCWNIIQ